MSSTLLLSIWLKRWKLILKKNPCSCSYVDSEKFLFNTKGSWNLIGNGWQLAVKMRLREDVTWVQSCRWQKKESGCKPRHWSLLYNEKQCMGRDLRSPSCRMRSFIREGFVSPTLSNPLDLIIELWFKS